MNFPEFPIVHIAINHESRNLTQLVKLIGETETDA